MEWEDDPQDRAPMTEAIDTIADLRRQLADVEANEEFLTCKVNELTEALENAKLFADVQNMKNYSEAMLESMSSGVVTLDDSGKVATCNAAGLVWATSRRHRETISRPPRAGDMETTT